MGEKRRMFTDLMGDLTALPAHDLLQPELADMPSRFLRDLLDELLTSPAHKILSQPATTASHQKLMPL